MNIDEIEIKKLVNILVASSGLSNLAMPALLVAVLPLTLGLLDVSLFGLGVMMLFVILLFFRRHLKSHKQKIIERLNQERTEHHISEKEYRLARRSLNILTVAGEN